MVKPTQNRTQNVLDPWEAETRQEASPDDQQTSVPAANSMPGEAGEEQNRLRAPVTCQIDHVLHDAVEQLWEQYGVRQMNTWLDTDPERATRLRHEWEGHCYQLAAERGTAAEAVTRALQSVIGRNLFPEEESP